MKRSLVMQVTPAKVINADEWNVHNKTNHDDDGNDDDNNSSEFSGCGEIKYNFAR